MDQCVSVNSNLDINPALNTGELSKSFSRGKRLHLPNFLEPSLAESLYHHLTNRVSWRTFVVANKRRLGTPPQIPDIASWEGERKTVELAHNAARNGFASVFDADRVLTDDDGSTRDAALQVLQGGDFIEFCRAVTGINSLSSVQLHATRFRCGHFVSFHEGTESADSSGKRRLSFELNLTPTWRPEWGGMLEFRGYEGHAIEGIMPCFNSLDLFAFPQGHWTSVVSDFASGARYAISGALYEN